MKDALIAIDQGTTGTTVLVLDRQLRLLGRSYREIPQHYPQPGWVSHDPESIWSSVLDGCREALENANREASQVAGIGLTNQRETSLFWERSSGRPLGPAIVWQCRRSAEIAERWRNENGDDIYQRTGLVADAYFSASKIAWWLENHPEHREAARNGEIAFGTVDCFLLQRLCGVHRMEISNASRTMLFNLKGHWDETLLDRFGIPAAILPEVVESVGHLGTVKAEWLGCEIPVMGIAGDQQAALFGQACFQPGEGKNTYGTGCFLMMQCGDRPVLSKHKLLSTIAWKIGGKISYGLEGSVFSAGSAVQWLRDGLGLLMKASESEEMARQVESSEGVVFVPAFTGLGAPYWDSQARGALFGVTRGSGRAHVVRAVLESVAFQVRDVVEAMASDLGSRPVRLKVDGGMSANNWLMQFQADQLGVTVERPKVVESTAFGAAALAALGLGWLSRPEELLSLREVDREFAPQTCDPAGYALWKRAVERSLAWL
ncbi:glycerol kinase GlpK [bacterium]|nr:glycerol kinase GlpK [bacterium]